MYARLKPGEWRVPPPKGAVGWVIWGREMGWCGLVSAVGIPFCERRMAKCRGQVTMFGLPSGQKGAQGWPEGCGSVDLRVCRAGAWGVARKAARRGARTRVWEPLHPARPAPPPCKDGSKSLGQAFRSAKRNSRSLTSSFKAVSFSLFLFLSSIPTPLSPCQPPPSLLRPSCATHLLAPPPPPPAPSFFLFTAPVMVIKSCLLLGSVVLGLAGAAAVPGDPLAGESRPAWIELASFG